MNKQQLRILERAFEAEVRGALNGGPTVLQTRSKLAEQLVEDGFLDRVSEKFGAVRVDGYGLTEAGHAFYCMSCGDSEEH